MNNSLSVNKDRTCFIHYPLPQKNQDMLYTCSVTYTYFLSNWIYLAELYSSAEEVNNQNLFHEARSFLCLLPHHNLPQTLPSPLLAFKTVACHFWLAMPHFSHQTSEIWFPFCFLKIHELSVPFYSLFLHPVHYQPYTALLYCALPPPPITFPPTTKTNHFKFSFLCLCIVGVCLQNTQHWI